jgi:amino acid transporter
MVLTQIASVILLPKSQGSSIAMSVAMAIPSVLQILASTVVTSRFIFALARDRGIPLSRFFVRTDKHKMPWAATVALLFALALSTVGWAIPRNYYDALLTGVNFYFITIPYVSGRANGLTAGNPTGSLPPLKDRPPSRWAPRVYPRPLQPPPCLHRRDLAYPLVYPGLYAAHRV